MGASESAQNQKLFRLKQIDEYVYHTNLKYATLQKLSIRYIWNTGLVYCGYVIPNSIILLVGVSLLAKKTLLVWLCISAIFLVFLTLGICAITIFIILLEQTVFATVFLILSLLVLLLLCYFWKTVYLLYKDIENDIMQSLHNVI